MARRLTGWRRSATRNTRGDGVLSRGSSIRRTAAGKRLPSMSLAQAMSLGHVACGAGDRVVGTAAVGQSNEVSNRRVEGMKIRMDVKGATVTATLDDNATSRDFVFMVHDPAAGRPQRGCGDALLSKQKMMSITRTPSKGPEANC